MAVLVVCFVLVVAVAVGIGALAHRRAWTLLGGPFRWGAAARHRFGAVPAALLVLVVGYVVTIAVGLGLGFLAKSLQTAVDEPALRWVHGHVHEGSKFYTANDKLTTIGNNTTVQLVLLVAGVVLLFAFRSRWWVPVVGLAVAYAGEKYVQRLLAHVVDRGHPPTTLGTYPSGGVGRILAVYGIVVALAIVLLPALSRTWRAGLWTGIGTLAAAEAFTRLYLSKHWLTDALFGLPFGTMLMLTNVAAVAALTAGSAVEQEQAARTPVA